MVVLINLEGGPNIASVSLFYSCSVQRSKQINYDLLFEKSKAMKKLHWVSHPRTTSLPKAAEILPPPIIDGPQQTERTEHAHEESGGGERKEKSVLQAKLTKLAIQILATQVC